MLSSDFSFLCMSKNCSISVIYSSSNEFIFCTIHFSFTQLHEMLRLSSNNEVKQKPSIRKQHLLLFDTCSYFASLASFETSIFQWLHLKQLNGFLWNPVLEIDTVFYSCIDHGFIYNWNLSKGIPLIIKRLFCWIWKCSIMWLVSHFFCNNKKYIIIYFKSLVFSKQN